MHYCGGLFVCQIKERGCVPSWNHIDLARLELFPVDEGQRLFSRFYNPFVFATSDDFTQEARIIG